MGFSPVASTPRALFKMRSRARAATRARLDETAHLVKYQFGVFEVDVKMAVRYCPQQSYSFVDGGSSDELGIDDRRSALG